MQYQSRKSSNVLPPVGDIYSNGYVVLPERLAKDGFRLDLKEGVNLLEFLRSMADTSFSNLIVKLNTLAVDERKREIAFLALVISSPIFQKNAGWAMVEVKEEFLKAIKDDDYDLGKLFTLINITKNELNNIINKKEWTNYRSRAINEKVIKILIDTVADKLNRSEKELNKVTVESVLSGLSGSEVNMDEVIAEAVRLVVRRDKKAVPEAEIMDIAKSLRKNAGLSRIIKDEGVKDSYTKTGIIDLGALLQLRLSKRGMVKASLRNLFKRLFWGMGAEVTVDLAHGRTYQSSRTHQGFRREGGRQKVDDVIELYNLEGRIDVADKQLDALFGSADLEGDLKKIYDTLDGFNKKITIHYNIKDYRFFKDTGFAESDFDIKDGNIKTRFNFVSDVTDEDLKTLLFMINNGAAGGLFAGRREDILAGISSIAVKWMFNDFEENIQYPESSSENLHIFVINGLYYPISAILRKLADQLKLVEKTRNIVSVTGTWPDALKEYSEEILFQPNVDFSRWKNLAGYVESSTSIRVKLNRSFFNISKLGKLS